MNMHTKIAAEKWVKIGTMDDIPRQGSRCISLGEKTVAVFRTVDDQVFALEDKCPHKNGPLSQGIVHDGCVTCPLHNWVISLATGEAQGADKGATAAYGIRIENDAVFLDIGTLV